MKIQITIKKPDVVIDAIDEALEDMTMEGLSDEELVEIKEKRKEEYLELADKFFEYGEYLTVELDTEKETCVVVPVKTD